MENDMTARVALGLRVIDLVGSRLDPTAPVAVGTIARELAVPLSTASRLCAELAGLEMLAPGEGYGTYRLGRGAIRLSGRAAAPSAPAVRYALTRIAQETGETAFLAAPAPRGVRVVSVVESPWTLHAPAEVGEWAAGRSAIVQASERGVQTTGAQTIETTAGKVVEVAAPVFGPSGDCVAVLAVRMPVYRAKRGARQAAAAIVTARRIVEKALAAAPVRQTPAPASTPADGASALAAALSILFHLADGADALVGTARAVGLRADRTRRLLESCVRSGLVIEDPDGGYRVSWVVHGWYRAAAPRTLVDEGAPFVARAAHETGACAFLTILKGMRSFTLVEELAVLGEGLRMREWLGRPHPIVGSDGGPTLVMDLRAEELAEIFPSRHTPQELDGFLERVARVVRDGVLSIGSIEEVGITSVSAPVRDASGTVAAAACIVGATESVTPRLPEFERAARELAARVSALLV
ncbi:hypothetical protein FVP77_16290 [Microbacterium hatanonis]|uniref:IclR-ED domain-containing protein n=2 Tax=Microbacterium hatanonis TaxID=404366 RepID=A0A5C8HZA3_9MICO|nr:hypothetical protein FVP77_16290 [Microbacterium hatanonis]